MKIKKEGSENNPRFKMMEGGDVYKDIERMYGVKVAKLLRQYCELKDIDPNVVVNDTSADRNGMCAWDKFDVWAKSKGVDFAAGFGDVDVDELLGVGKPKKTRARGRATRFYDRPVNSDIYGEGSGSRMDEYAIAENIGEYIRDCEWAENFNWGDFSDMTFEVDGFGYRVTVTKEFAPEPEEL